MSSASSPIKYGTLVPATSLRVNVRYRSLRYAADLLLLAFTLLVLPNFATVLLFGPTTQFFRGWLNLEFCLIVGAYVYVRRWPVLILLAFEIVVDLVEPVAHVFYFTPSDALDALKFLSVLPTHRLVFYSLSLVAYVSILLGAVYGGTRRLRCPRFSVSVILMACCLGAATDLLAGRYVYLGTDRHSESELFTREPFTALARRAVKTADVQTRLPPQRIDSAVGRMFATDGEMIRQRRPNVVVVLVESWGQFKDARIRDQLAAPLTTLSTRSRYAIETGAVPFVGPTVFGESREFCGQIFGQGIDKASVADLQNCSPGEFGRMGYDTLGINGFFPRMSGRIRWYPKLFQRVLFAPQLESIGLRTCPGALVGTCDEDVADLIHRELLVHSSGRPIFLHWTSLNSHLPVQANSGVVNDSGCSDFAATRDDAVCTWYSLVTRALKAIDRVATDPALNPTVFVVVGDHAPPFIGAERRAEFSQTQVPYVILAPIQKTAGG